MSASDVEQADYAALEAALRSGRLDQLPLRVSEHGDYPNVRDPYTGTPLVILAISWAPISTIEQLLDAGADVNVDVEDGFPAVLNAVMSQRDDRIEVVEVLVDHGADLDRRGVNGWTPLHAAASTNDAELVSVLLRLGADATARTGIDDDATPLEEARRAGATAAVRLLTKA
jgi:ankyrin repeat protein